MNYGIASPYDNFSVQDVMSGFNNLDINVTNTDFEAIIHLDSEGNLVKELEVVM